MVGLTATFLKPSKAKTNISGRIAVHPEQLAHDRLTLYVRLVIVIEMTTFRHKVIVKVFRDIIK